MQQLETSKQIVEEQKYKRMGKGQAMAQSRRIYRLMQTEDVFYVESESNDNVYYFVKFKPDVFGWCSCKDNSTRDIKCKHLFAIEFAIKWATIKDIDKVPSSVAAAAAPVVDTDQSTSNDIHAATIPVVARRTKSYRDDDYDF